MSKIQWMSINGKPMGIVETDKLNRVERYEGTHIFSEYIPIYVVEEITDIAHVEGAWVKKETDVPNS